MSADIDVTDVAPGVLLQVLYMNARVQGLGFLHSTSGPLTVEEIEDYLKDMPQYFDYLKGRVMKVEIDGKTLSPNLYDRDNGPGAAERCVLEAKQIMAERRP